MLLYIYIYFYIYKMIESKLDYNKKDWSNVFDFSNYSAEVIPFKVNQISYFRKAFNGFVVDILGEQKKIYKI